MVNVIRALAEAAQQDANLKDRLRTLRPRQLLAVIAFVRVMAEEREASTIEDVLRLILENLDEIAAFIELLFKIFA